MRTLIASRHSIALVWLIASAGCKDKGASDCSPGTLACECRDGASCDPGLVCDTGICEASFETSDGMESSSTTGPTDPCMSQCVEGQVCEDGACVWPFDCEIECTEPSASGSCYCQTTCTGYVEIFTCFDDGTCTCQGGGRPTKEIEAKCTSLEAAEEIYYLCHRK